MQDAFENLAAKAHTLRDSGAALGCLPDAGVALVPVLVDAPDGFGLGTGIGPVETDPTGSYQSWVSQEDGLYTRVGLGGDRFAGYRWDFDGGAGIGAFAVGTVCIDDTATPPAYER